MAHPKYIEVKETKQQLKSLQRNCIPLIYPRIQMLLCMKRHGKNGVSRRKMAEELGISDRSVQTWRNLYERQGIDGLLKHGRTGFKPSLIQEHEHKNLENKLKDPKNGIRGYMELLRWFNEKHNRNIKYHTLVKYCIRHFKTKIKVARKSHVKKDEQAVEVFKKTLVGTV